MLWFVFAFIIAAFCLLVTADGELAAFVGLITVFIAFIINLALIDSGTNYVHSKTEVKGPVVVKTVNDEKTYNFTTTDNKEYSLSEDEVEVTLTDKAPTYTVMKKRSPEFKWYIFHSDTDKLAGRKLSISHNQ